MEIDQEFEGAILADVDVVLQQPGTGAAVRVEQLAEVLLGYAEGELLPAYCCKETGQLPVDRV
jgi:hypothetical protein